MNADDCSRCWWLRAAQHSTGPAWTRLVGLILFLGLVLIPFGSSAQVPVPGTSIPQGAFTPKVTRYDLYVTDTLLNYTGKDVHAIAVNGQTPMPTLHFLEGDTAMIVLHNNLRKGETSLHWHGLILPNQFDGVPWLTTPPIKAGHLGTKLTNEWKRISATTSVACNGGSRT